MQPDGPEFIELLRKQIKEKRRYAEYPRIDWYEEDSDVDSDAPLDSGESVTTTVEEITFLRGITR